MRKKNGLTLLVIGIVFLAIAVLIGHTYYIGLHRPPLKYANIPDITKDYLRNLNLNNREQGITLVDLGPFDWDNAMDLGQNISQDETNDDDQGENQNRKGWQQVENENFIVYYPFDEDAVWQGHALDVMRHAQENIEPLRELFGTYVYPSDVNGRRLSIYLPVNNTDYKETVCKLLEQPNYDVTNLAGITITEIGPLGCLTRGIVLSPNCFKVEDNHVNGYVKVLQHEMSHYVFFTSLDYNKDVHHYLWLSEGIAEYFCSRSNRHQVCGADSINRIRTDCQLDEEFSFEDSYWAGESFFLFMDKTKGKNTIKEFLQNSYVYSTDSVFIKMGMPTPELHDQWVESLMPIDTFSVAILDEMP